MTIITERGDYAVLNDRMSHLLLLRVGFVAVVLAWSSVRPASLGIPLAELGFLGAAYLSLSLGVEVIRRHISEGGFSLLTALLLVDGIYLACTMYATGGTQSPIRFLIYLHLVAVSLLASYRTGLKIALWHSLLLFVVLYAQASRLIPAVDVAAGEGIAFDQMPVLNVTAFWLFALATSVFSAMNERELRQRRMDLQALVEVGSRLDEVRDPGRQAQLVLDGLVQRFGFARGLLLQTVEGKVSVLAAVNAIESTDDGHEADWVIARACEKHDQVLVKHLNPARDPFLTRALPDARNLMISPMVADGLPVGVIVLEWGQTRTGGIERRVASVVGQFSSMAALNLRNAILLERVKNLAEHDALTGAANRRMFELSLDRVLAARSGRRQSARRVVSILFIDLDDFKVINDTYGHEAGDALLVAVTERIITLVRETDLVARLGGDEFAVLTDDDMDLNRSRSMAERLVHELQAPYDVGANHIAISASIGIASTLDQIAGSSDLVRNADVAMYLAKADGKARFAVFDPAMHAATHERHRLSAQLQRAVELGQLRLVYQPILDLVTGRMVGAEALVRWIHPDRGFVLPSQFIAIAEESDAIMAIDQWVFAEACRDLDRWERECAGASRLFMSVNVSAREVQHPGFSIGIRETLAEASINPSRLVLEITETALLKATSPTVEALGALRAMGIRIAIDDFGTGYCSLSHLRQFPVDVLKIAAEFVEDNEPGSRSPAVAGAIVALSRSLGIEAVAEGIETPNQAERMRALGCRYGQGYHFSKPLPGSELVEKFSRPGSMKRRRTGTRSSRKPKLVVLPDAADRPVMAG